MISLLLSLALVGIDWPPFGGYKQECEDFECEEAVVYIDEDFKEQEETPEIQYELAKSKVCLPGPDGIVVCL